MLDQDTSGYIVDEQGESTGEELHWDMMYDQAMIVTIPSRNLKLMANFRYSVDPRVPEDLYPKLSTTNLE